MVNQIKHLKFIKQKQETNLQKFWKWLDQQPIIAGFDVPYEQKKLELQKKFCKYYFDLQQTSGVVDVSPICLAAQKVKELEENKEIHKSYAMLLKYRKREERG